MFEVAGPNALKFLRQVHAAGILDKSTGARKWVALVKAALARVHLENTQDKLASEMVNYLLAEVCAFRRVWRCACVFIIVGGSG